MFLCLYCPLQQHCFRKCTGLIEQKCKVSDWRLLQLILWSDGLCCVVECMRWSLIDTSTCFSIVSVTDQRAFVSMCKLFLCSSHCICSSWISPASCWLMGSWGLWWSSWCWSCWFASLPCCLDSLCSLLGEPRWTLLQHIHIMQR